MERSRHGESHENTAQSLFPVGKLDQYLTTEPPMLPDYLTLELDVSDFQAFMSEADTASTQSDWEMYECQNPEVLSLDVPELLEPEESTLPGYLTLEIDLNALGDIAPWRSSHNAASDESSEKA
jgi:hypothetical protein